MKKGLFIVYEGIDGAGKTTQVEMLARFIPDRGHRVVVTRDPGGTSLGEGLRNVLLYGGAPIDPRAEVFMYAAARAQLVAETIIPALEKGLVVLSDRFADSTHAYQGRGRYMDPDFLESVTSYACRGTVPDLTILLDMDPAMAAARIKRPADRMEREGLEFLGRVRKGYLDRAKGDPGRYLVLDATLPPDRLFALASASVDKLLASKCELLKTKF